MDMQNDFDWRKGLSGFGIEVAQPNKDSITSQNNFPKHGQ